MMRCEQAQEMAARLAAGDDEITSTERQRLEEHLGACTLCAREAPALSRIIAALRVDEVPDPGPVYWAAFTGRLRSRIAAGSPRRAVWLVPALAAAAAVLIASGLAIHRWTRSPQTSRTDLTASQGSTGAALTAEARFEALLTGSPNRDENRRQAESILDELVPIDPLELDDALDTLTPEEAAILIEDLRSSES